MSLKDPSVVTGEYDSVFFHPCIAGQICADAPISASEKNFSNQSEVVSVGGDGTFFLSHTCRLLKSQSLV